MSPILDLQQRLVEVGRIRMGHKAEFTRQDGSSGSRPARLDTWRLTSNDEERLAQVAQVFGGEVQAWENGFEVITTVNALPILVLPGQALTQWWEMWSGGGCLRRCDGHTEMISGDACKCPDAYDERTEGASANPPTACKPTTRLSVLLPDIPGIGHWRLETHGFYAAVELAATAGLLQQATATGQLVPARLRIDQRSKIEGGKTTKWSVPVIDVDLRVPDLVAVLGTPVAAYTPLSAPAGASLDQGLKALEPAATEAAVRSNAQEPIPNTPPAPAAPEVPAEPAPEPEPAPPLETVMISRDQQIRLFAMATSHGVAEEQLRLMVIAMTGQSSTKEIPVVKYEALTAAIEALPLAAAEEGGEATPLPAPDPTPPPQEPVAEPQQTEVGDPAPSESPASDVTVELCKATVLGPEFSRYAGKSVYDVAGEDARYLSWLASDVIKNDDVRRCAQYMLTTTT